MKMRIILSGLIISVLVISGCASKTVINNPEIQQNASEDGMNDSSAKIMGKDIKRELSDEKTSSSRTLSIRETVNGSVVFFDYDKSDLTSEATKSLDTDAAILKANTGIIIKIEGHCDERGTVEYNLALGERRADAVRKYFISTGVDSSRISIISYGKEKPVDPGHNEEAWAKNRRALIRIVSGNELKSADNTNTSSEQ